MKGSQPAGRLRTTAPAGAGSTDVSTDVPSRDFVPQNYSKQLFSELFRIMKMQREGIGKLFGPIHKRKETEGFIMSMVCL